MGNADTLKAIEDNLKALLAAQGFMVEDSSPNPALDVKPLCTLRLQGENFENTFGERPSYSNVNYDLLISHSAKNPSASRDMTADLAHKIRSNVTVNALNTGALSASKLVSRVEHDYDIDYSLPVTRITYRLKIRYREI